MTTTRTVDVLIVEAHHHCLEHIHSILRKKKILRPWSMIHFDAHPDLACPSVPAKACFTPRQFHDNDDSSSNNNKDLYELLDSNASGIAEWILPLVMAAQLQTIDWIKPSSSKQLPCGHHRYHVGAFDPSTTTNNTPRQFWDLNQNATLKVDWNHPYYLDDDSVVATETLMFPQTVDLCVTELDNTKALPVVVVPIVRLSELFQKNSQPWVLDICLDYFACWNPYLADIDKVDPQLTNAFLKIMEASTCFQEDILAMHNPSFQPNPIEHYQQNVQDFRFLLRQVLSSDSATTDVTELSQFFASLEVCQELVDNLRNRMRLYENHIHDLIMEAIPFWNMPHVTLAAQNNVGINESILRIEEMLLHLMDITDRSSKSLPFLITIARSTVDGFTPSQVVEEIQEAVIQMLHRVFCKACPSNCGLRLVKDYGEWEGATL